MHRPNHGGGWQAIAYTLRKAKESGGLLKFWRAMRSKNACKTCALGMGGQRGGMVNEAGHFPEVCKKSLQAMAADMQPGIPVTFWDEYPIQRLQTLTPRELEACGRLTQPVVCEAGDTRYRPVTWGEAMRRIAGKLKETLPDETFWYFSGRSSNEAAFLLQLFVRVYGTNHVNNCSYYCHQASGVGLGRALGTGTATLSLDDLEQADLVFVIGGNPASNHPRLMTVLKNLRRRGGQVIVINPVVETGLVNFRVPSDIRSMLLGSEIASLYVQPHIGGDLALLTGIAKRVVELGACDDSFLSASTNGWPELRARLQSLGWDEICEKSGVDRPTIEQIAQRYGQSKNAVFSWTMGITHHLHGVQNVEAIVNLALLRGMVGRPNAGLLPIRGHSNVQGIGSMGVAPQLKQAVFDRLQSHFGVQLPTTPGLDTLGCLEAAAEGKFRFATCLGGNLYGASPDATFAQQALAQLDQLVYLNTTLNTGHAHGLAKETFILPVLARDEEPEPTTQESMFNYVRLSDGGPARHSGTKSEVQVIAGLARLVLGDEGPILWRELERTSKIRAAIAQIVPGFERIAEIERTKQEFHIGGRILHQGKFPTPDGRARMYAHDLPELESGPGELRLMTIRSEGQFNTVVYEDYDLYRGVDRRDVILLHPDDIRRLQLAHGQRVTVRNETGRLDNVFVHAFDAIKPGNAAMYCPEANVLVPRRVDPASRTPAFKSVLVEIEATVHEPATV